MILFAAFLGSNVLSRFVLGNWKRMVLKIPQAWNFPQQSCLECLSVALVVVDELVEKLYEVRYERAFNLDDVDQHA